MLLDWFCTRTQTELQFANRLLQGASLECKQESPREQNGSLLCPPPFHSGAPVSKAGVGRKEPDVSNLSQDALQLCLTKAYK